MQIGFRLCHLLQQTVAILTVRRHFLAGNPDRQAARHRQRSAVPAGKGSKGAPSVLGGSTAPAGAVRPAAACLCPRDLPSALQSGDKQCVCSVPTRPTRTWGLGRAALPGQGDPGSTYRAQQEGSGLLAKTGPPFRNQIKNRIETHLITLGREDWGWVGSWGENYWEL